MNKYHTSKITKRTQASNAALHLKQYYSSQFATDSIPTDLPAKPAPHLEPMNYDSRAQLEFKHELTGAEMKEKQARQEWIMAVIEGVCQRLSEDKEVQGRIQQIQAHPWVRVVEGEA